MNVTDVRVIQYALTLIVDLLEPAPDARARLLAKPGAPAGARPYVLPFLQLVGATGSGARITSADANAYVVDAAAAAAALLLAGSGAAAGPDADATSVSSLLAWVLTNMSAGFSPASPRQVRVTEAALAALAVLLRDAPLRALFVEERGLERALKLAGAPHAQTRYGALAAVWAVSLYKPDGPAAVAAAGGVAAVARAAAAPGQPAKVLRVGLGALANVVREPRLAPEALTTLCESGLPALVAGLLRGEERVRDPELADDLAALDAALAGHAAKALTSLERFEGELGRRRLEWNAAHSPDFWREHAGAFEKDGFRLLKALCALVEDGRAGRLADDTTLAVACADLGEFAVAHPQGRA